MSYILEANHLAAGYGDLAVVRDLDLQVGAGEVVALLGANGAGKTTTLLTLSGELPQLDGDVAFLGEITTAPLHVRARSGLALVTEERSVTMQLSAAENLRTARCDAARAIDMFPELEPHLGRRVGLLSGGQQQMLALARALARPTRLLLADELSLGLAPQVVDRLLAVVRSAAADGVGVLLVEQYVHKVMEVADRILVMRHGEIVLEGPVRELSHRVDEIQAAYLN
jgi:ABC-type branched-subunit amino acid transport system ATPase component